MNLQTSKNHLENDNVLNDATGYSKNLRNDSFSDNNHLKKTKCVYNISSNSIIKDVDLSSWITSCDSDIYKTHSQSECIEIETISSSPSHQISNFNLLNSSTPSKYEVSKTIEVHNGISISTENTPFLHDSNTQISIPPTIYQPYFKTCLKCRKENTNPHFQYCCECFHGRLQVYGSKIGPKPKRIKHLIGMLDSKIKNNDSRSPSSIGVNKVKEVGKMCNICFIKPLDGLFNHGKIGHMYCCYKCARQIWNKSGKCPICNQKVRCVSKMVLA